jgi:hypothetical protein
LAAGSKSKAVSQAILVERTGMILVIVDATQIQSYVFASNRLRENIGASHLVAQATGQWALEAVAEAAASHNIVDFETGDLNPALQIEVGDGPQAEVVYTGGGNAVVLFKTSDQAKAFRWELSRRALLEAPGLQLVMADSEEFEWGQRSLAHLAEDVFKKLGVQKRAPRVSAPLLGLAVSVECQSTALPAVQEVHFGPGDERPVSAETAAKWKAVEQANERLTKVVGELDASYQYPLELDRLGRTAGDQSHIAVVHADGDGIGKRIEALGRQHNPPGQTDWKQINRDYVDALRAFSKAVNEAARAALQITRQRLAAAIERDADGHPVIAHLPARQAGVDWIPSVTLAPVKELAGAHYFPFRPIVFGGDDVTFVCDGRLGVTLAKLYAEEFAKETGARVGYGGSLTACAGVAIVKAHYPFARAYQLAEELIKSAKQYRREIKDQNEDWQDACFDWHFALSGLSGSLKEIRHREYTAPSGLLLLRPLTLGQNPRDKRRAWSVLENFLIEFQAKTESQTKPEWADRRNKMKALRDALREGEAAVEQFLKSFYSSALPDARIPPTGLPLAASYRTQGWTDAPDRRCLYFDAVEMADWYIPLLAQLAAQATPPPAAPAPEQAAQGGEQ